MNSQPFSQRNGFSEIIKIQEKEITEALTNLLWNVFDRYLNKRGYRCDNNLYGDSTYSEDRVNHFVVIMVEHFASQQLDQIRIENSYYKIQKCKDLFYSLIWYKKYDFIEFFLGNGDFSWKEKEQFIDLMNERLARENSAYRIIGGLIVPIIDKTDINAIESVLSLPESYENTKKHLQNALKKLSDKQTPDYKNSIKESVSSIESLFRQLFSINNDLASSNLSDIIKKKDRMPFFPVDLLKSVSQLYGTSSDVGGVRHADKPISQPIIEKSDAIFVIVFCSAIISYVISKKTYSEEST